MLGRKFEPGDVVVVDGWLDDTQWLVTHVSTNGYVQAHIVGQPAWVSTLSPHQLRLVKKSVDNDD